MKRLYYSQKLGHGFGGRGCGGREKEKGGKEKNSDYIICRSYSWVIYLQSFIHLGSVLNV